MYVTPPVILSGTDRRYVSCVLTTDEERREVAETESRADTRNYPHIQAVLIFPITLYTSLVLPILRNREELTGLYPDIVPLLTYDVSSKSGSGEHEAYQPTTPNDQHTYRGRSSIARRSLMCGH